MKKIAAATAILMALVAALFCFLPTFAENPGHRAQKPAADQQKAEEKSPPDTDPPRTDEKCVYLTFDDGPTDSVTPKILDVLAREKVQKKPRNEPRREKYVNFRTFSGSPKRSPAWEGACSSIAFR